MYVISNYDFHNVERMSIEKLFLVFKTRLDMYSRYNEYIISLWIIFGKMHCHKALLWAPPFSNGGLLPKMERGGPFEKNSARWATLLTFTKKPGVAWRLLAFSGLFGFTSFFSRLDAKEPVRRTLGRRLAWFLIIGAQTIPVQPRAGV